MRVLSKEKLLSRSFQLLILGCTIVLFTIIQAAIFRIGSGMIASVVVIAFLGCLLPALIIFWILNAKRASKNQPNRVDFLSVYFYSCIVLLLTFSFSPAANKTESATESSASYSNIQTHHCSWCGKEYSGSGYMHVANQCVHPEQDPGIDIQCSENCCSDSWKSTH